jgi:quercetin dioxygenase-like cupin family protein
MLQGKVWGQTAELFNKNNVEIHRISINAGGYCSEHKHEGKFNAFFVESGTVDISVWADEDRPDSTRLSAGDYMVVPPGKFHKFEASTYAVVYEIYWVELTEDIVRRTEGGIV